MLRPVLITGASGYLAHRLVPVASEYTKVVGTACSSDSVHSPAQFQRLDIADTDAVRQLVANIQPGAIIHTAASNPGADESLMDAINHLGSRNVAQAAVDSSCRLVVVSSDVVHNGREAPYADDAQSNPINPYGSSKANAEHAVLNICPNAIVVRTSLIYGLDKIDRGTAGFAKRLQNGQALTLYDNVLRQPVWVDSLSNAICKLAFEQHQEAGLINIAGNEVISRAKFGQMLLEFWQVNGRKDVRHAAANDGDGVPIDLTLDCHRAVSLGYDLPGISDVLFRHSAQATRVSIP